MSDDDETVFNALLASDVDAATAYAASVSDSTGSPERGAEPGQKRYDAVSWVILAVVVVSGLVCLMRM